MVSFVGVLLNFSVYLYIYPSYAQAVAKGSACTWISALVYGILIQCLSRILTSLIATVTVYSLVPQPHPSLPIWETLVTQQDALLWWVSPYGLGCHEIPA